MYDNLFFAYLPAKLLHYSKTRWHQRIGDRSKFWGKECDSTSKNVIISFFLAGFLAFVALRAAREVTWCFPGSTHGDTEPHWTTDPAGMSTPTPGNSSQGRDWAEKSSSVSPPLHPPSGCQISRVNYIEILSEMTDEICLFGPDMELQVIHDMW